MPRCVHLASDLHLGAPNSTLSRERERAFVHWMRDAAEGRRFAEGKPATELHLVGDIFDFWHEYHHVVPKGGARVMGAIAELTDAGLPVHYHVGNHDLWTYGYLEEELGVSEEVSSFVLPLGATINMDGTALYQAVAAVFIAQTLGMDLSLGAQLTIVLTAVLASIGTAAVPGAGVIMLVIILEAISVPSAGIALILGVDRILDMLRTVTNVTGDASVAVAVASSEGELKK